MNKNPMPAHALANIFPLLEGGAFREMVEDIREHGLREPIVLLNGQILDGRNRARACHAAQVDARYEFYTGNDPLGFVISKNLHRRHLDASQRSLIAAEISTRLYGGRRGPSTKLGGKTAVRPRPERYKPARDDAQLSSSEAARLMNVSGSAVGRARLVIESGIPEVRAAVQSGALSVYPASLVALSPPDKQKALLDAGPKAIAALAKDVGYGHRKRRKTASVQASLEFRLGDGRKLTSVRYSQIEGLIRHHRALAAVLEMVRDHVADGGDKLVGDLITNARLTDFIETAFRSVASASHPNQNNETQ